MRIMLVIISILYFSPFFSMSQDIFGIPKEQRDSVYIYFIEHDGRYYSFHAGTIDGVKRMQYKIKLQFGLDLCFSTGYNKPEKYTTSCSFEDLKDKEVKDYWYLYNNYMDEDMEELLKKLRWDSTRFF